MTAIPVIYLLFGKHFVVNTDLIESSYLLGTFTKLENAKIAQKKHFPYNSKRNAFVYTNQTSMSWITRMPIVDGIFKQAASMSYISPQNTTFHPLGQ